MADRVVVAVWSIGVGYSTQVLSKMSFVSQVIWVKSSQVGQICRSNQAGQSYQVGQAIGWIGLVNSEIQLSRSSQVRQS